MLHKKTKGFEKPLKEEISKLKDAEKKSAEEIKNLTNKNQELHTLNETLAKKTQQMQDKLDEYLGEGLTPKEVQSNMYKDLKSKVECGDLDYKHNEPPIVGKGQQKVYEDAVDLPKNEPTKNRSNIKELDIPEIKPDGSFECQIPMSNEAKIVKCNSKAFQAAKNKTTTLSEDYASSVEWNDDKIARDILQNFFDGHGQTLDGVRIKFTPAGIVSELKEIVHIPLTRLFLWASQQKEMMLMLPVIMVKG